VEIDWTTFLLEILNFLVLVWLLKRLFYQPVREAIDRRRQGIEEQLRRADEMGRTAEALNARYAGRMADWERERLDASAGLAKEIDEQRKLLLSGLQRELVAERRRNEILAERENREFRQETERRAMEIGGRFAAGILRELGSAEIESGLIGMLLRDLHELPDEQRSALAVLAENGRQETVRVVSAYPLDENCRTSIRRRLDSLLPLRLPCDFREDPELIAGLRITVGPLVIHANLQDELKWFATAAGGR